VVFVNSSAELEEVVREWLKLEWLAVDTEFERRTTFYAKLALVQIYDGQNIYLIDPFEVDCPRELKKVFESPSVIKIFHSSKEDLEVLYTAWNCRIQGLFDTQVANSFLTGEISLGYAKITEIVTGIFVDKQETTSDWVKRPLGEKQLDYAAKDVLYLPEIYQILKNKITDKNYYQYFQVECQEYTQQAIERVESFADYREAKDAWRLNGKDLSLFQVLFDWRELTARADNRTRNHIIKEPELVELAEVKPVSVEQIKQLLHLHPRSIRLYAATWIAIIEKWQQAEPIELIPILNPRDISGLKKVIDQISKIVDRVADEKKIAKTLLFSKRLIRKLAFSTATKSKMPMQWSGWRKNLLAAYLKAEDLI